MAKDAIVDEIRRIREEFAARHEYDLDEIVRALRKASEDGGRTVVSLPPRPVSTEGESDRKAG